MYKNKTELVKKAMLAVQRYPWEQGVCAQACLEVGDISTAIAMAHDAVLRQTEDGRLAVITNNIAVTDPAANGEVVLQAFLVTREEKYKNAADKQLKYLMEKAPRTDKNIICHNEVSFHEGFSPYQIWVDAIYMAPPFLAAMNKSDEALDQIKGYIKYLKDDKTNLLFHIYDAGTNKFVRKKLWATGNGWALMGIARVIDHSLAQNRTDITSHLYKEFIAILDGMLKFQLQDGRFHDIVDDKSSFVDGTGAMMVASAIFRGIAEGWLDKNYATYAQKVIDTMDNFIDEYGIIHEVCGCPHFLSCGTSAESMASYLMMHAQYNRYKKA